jgi:hypothetical protein
MGKKLKQTNVNDLIANTTEAASIFFDIGKKSKQLKELEEKKNEKQKVEWVYALLERHGNVFVNEKTYNLLDEKRLGNYSIDFIKKTTQDEKDGYVIWKI